MKSMKQKNDRWVERFKKEVLPVVLHECQPEKVVLFGSRVTGEANEESDLDVIVVAKIFEHIPFIRRMAFMLKKVRFTKHIDFLCYAPQEFERIQRTSAVLQDALQHGEVISTQSSLSYPDKVAESQEALSYDDNITLSRTLSRQLVKAFERIDNPYRSGNLIQELQRGNTSMFYGRRDTIRELKNILIENDEGLVILYGQRRTGKSCLLKYIEKAKCFAPDVQIIFTNIQGLASEQDFYVDILNQAVHLTDTASNIKTQVHSFDEFTTSLYTLQEAIKTPFLIMLDEFEYVTDERFEYTSLQDATDFIRRLRNLIQYSTQIKFALAGADGLREMINDYHNPLFKAGRTFHIAFLNSQDARALITEPLQDRVDYTEQAITSIQNVTANHPYYIQLLCQTIVMLLNSKKSNRVTITEVTQAIKQIEKTGDSNFDYVWDITPKEAHLLLAIIAYEIQEKQWISLERIEEAITEHKLSLPEQSVDIALKVLLEKDLIIENQTKLEYTIPMGLLCNWISRYKPLKKVQNLPTPEMQQQ